MCGVSNGKCCAIPPGLCSTSPDGVEASSRPQECSLGCTEPLVRHWGPNSADWDMMDVWVTPGIHPTCQATRAGQDRGWCSSTVQQVRRAGIHVWESGEHLNPSTWLANMLLCGTVAVRACGCVSTPCSRVDGSCQIPSFLVALHPITRKCQP